jgi:Tol biopolymer transport system component
MKTARVWASALRRHSLLAILTSVAIIAVFAASQTRRANNSPATSPKLISVTEVTHDGLSKTKLQADNAHLYVTELSAARHVIAKVSLEGSQRSITTSPFPSVQALDLSPDHSKLLVTPMKGSGDTEFWTLRTDNGSPERLGTIVGRDGSWSPDGESLAFGKGSSLYVASAKGAQEKELYKASGSVFAPRFSPDGKRIRFTIGDAAENTTSLWEVGRDGSNPHALLGDWQKKSTACCGSWTADGRYYIFQVTQSSPTTLTTLWALPESGSGSNPMQLTTGPMSFGNTSPSADNKNIWAIGVRPAGEAVTYDSKKNKFAQLLSGVSATDLSYSADGQWVTYVAVPDGSLWRCRADGTERLQLTTPPDRTALPNWSPDGKQIAYVSLQPGKPWRIALISANGGTPKEMLPETRSQVDANWSSDGSKIMYGYVVRETEEIDIRILDLKTQKIEIVPGSEDLFSPRWSPDGRYIAALSRDFTTVKLYDFATKKWSNWLTEPAGAVSYLVWSGDSKYIYFDDLVTDEESIRRVKVGEDHAERVFALKGIERYPGPFGLWAGRAADGSWMFVRDRSTQEVYRLGVELP